MTIVSEHPYWNKSYFVDTPKRFSWSSINIASSFSVGMFHVSCKCIFFLISILTSSVLFLRLGKMLKNY